MPKNPDRPILKRKRVKKPPPRRKTPEAIAAKKLARTEKRLDITPAKVIAVIAAQHGLLTQVCRSLKVPRTTMLRYIDKHPACVEALQHARDAMGDVAERKLFDAIKAGDTRCLLFYLSTAQRHRGYAMGNGYNPDAAAEQAHGPVYVETVNIIGVPRGTFLPKEVAGPVIDNNG